MISVGDVPVAFAGSAISPVGWSALSERERSSSLLFSSPLICSSVSLRFTAFHSRFTAAPALPEVPNAIRRIVFALRLALLPIRYVIAG